MALANKYNLLACVLNFKIPNNEAPSMAKNSVVAKQYLKVA